MEKEKSETKGLGAEIQGMGREMKNRRHEDTEKHKRSEEEAARGCTEKRDTRRRNKREWVWKRERDLKSICAKRRG